MKDARFKELLNLHLDNRLSPAEAAELEAAISADPARRKAVRDYEAMQSACASLFAHSESCAPSSAALLRSLRQAESRIEHPRAFRGAWTWQTWGLTGGLAACVALVVARISQPAMPIAQQQEETNLAQARPIPMVGAAAPAEPVAIAAPAPGQLAFAALGLSPNSANADAASRWILQNEEPGVYATAEEANAAAAAMPAWRQEAVATAVAARHFSSRPINAWSQNASASGYQVETASYRFER